LIVVDTSVAVAAFASWHEHHDAALRTVDRGARLVGHCAVETYSVLTRLPPPHRAAAKIVPDWLADRFPKPPLVFSAAEHRRFVATLPERGVLGGAAYDALVAETVRARGATIATLDRRALGVYERYGIEVAGLRSPAYSPSARTASAIISPM
jgi:predicted nucleic acid-binding protein